jgi:hypothetical protein
MNKPMPKVRQYTTTSAELLENGALQPNLLQPLKIAAHQDRAIVSLASKPSLGIGS